MVFIHRRTHQIREFSGAANVHQALAQLVRQVLMTFRFIGRKTIGKPMGKPWENGGFMGFDGNCSSGNLLQFAIEHGPVEMT